MLKVTHFPTAHAFGVPVGVTRRNFTKTFGFEKLESLVYHAVFLRDDRLSRFDRQRLVMDRQTDTRTPRISRWHGAARHKTDR